MVLCKALRLIQTVRALPGLASALRSPLRTPVAVVQGLRSHNWDGPIFAGGLGSRPPVSTRSSKEYFLPSLPQTRLPLPMPAVRILVLCARMVSLRGLAPAPLVLVH